MTDTAKKAAGKAACEFLKDGMIIGLGTGSTAFFFIEALGKRCTDGLKITAVATSTGSSKQANELGIPLISPDDVSHLDMTIDGADEIDPQKNMIKGGGGALLREKLLAKASKELIIILDESKAVGHLGKHPLPVEICSFLYLATVQKLMDKGYHGSLRMQKNQHMPFVTDNGNFIFDIQYANPILDPEQEHNQLKQMTGVIETGFFFQIAKKVIIGYHDGKTKIID